MSLSQALNQFAQNLGRYPYTQHKGEGLLRPSPLLYKELSQRNNPGKRRKTSTQASF